MKQKNTFEIYKIPLTSINKLDKNKQFLPPGSMDRQMAFWMMNKNASDHRVQNICGMQEPLRFR